MGFSDRRAVVYPMSKKAADRGRSRMSWVVVLPASPPARTATWDHKVANDLAVEPFKDWNFSWLDFAGLIRQTREIYEYPEADRDPLPRWSFGRVTLLGDAAHPMRPAGAQAGSQAVVDARFLAFSLAQRHNRRSGLGPIRRAAPDRHERRNIAEPRVRSGNCDGACGTTRSARVQPISKR